MSITPLSVGQMIKSHYLLKYYHQPISKTLPIVIIERYHDVLAIFSFSMLFVMVENIPMLKIPIFSIAVIFAAFTLVTRSSGLIRSFERLINKISLLKKSKTNHLISVQHCFQYIKGRFFSLLDYKHDSMVF